MKLKILVLDQEQSLRELLRTYLTRQGHDVMAYGDPATCPLYRNLTNERCCCTRTSSCADVILADINLPTVNTLDFLELQRRRGCKALDANKAVLSTRATNELRAAIEAFGCHLIKKPFRLEEIGSWLRDCQKRLAAK